MLHGYASNQAKLVVLLGLQRLLKKYGLCLICRLTSPHWFWQVMRAHAPSTIATAMLTVARTRITRQPGVIISPTYATYGLVYSVSIKSW